jgi:hypothetical protein
MTAIKLLRKGKTKNNPHTNKIVPEYNGCLTKRWIPFTFNSEAGTGVNIDLTPLSSIKYFFIEINMMVIPGKTKNRMEKYGMSVDLMSIGLSKEY